MRDWESSGGVKIKRAKKHLRDLKAGLDDFVARDPYGVVTKVDEEARIAHYYARVSEQPDPDLGAIIGDALHNLRSALDIMWRQVWHPEARASTHTEEFRIFDSSDDFKARYSLAKLPKQARKKSAVLLLHEIKPYKGGNDLLWMLNEANAVDKHRLLIPAIGFLAYIVAETIGLESASGLTFPPLRTEFRSVGILSPITDGAYLTSHTLDHPPGVDVEVKPVLEITFGECEALKGKALTNTLRQFVGVVEGIAETFLRAGLIR